MKFFRVSLAAALLLSACAPVTKTHRKSVSPEADEEARYALAKPSIEGVILELSDSGRQIVARKQGKVWMWSTGLRSDETAGIKRRLREMDPAHLWLENDGGTLHLHASRQNFLRGIRKLDTRLRADSSDPTRWLGRQENEDIVVTCLPDGSGSACDPTHASVIEFKSAQSLSNHRPRTIAYLYGESPAQAAVDGGLTQRLGSGLSATVRSVSVLNSEAETPSYLLVEVVTRHGVFNFLGEHNGRSVRGMDFRLERSWGLDGYRLIGGTNLQVESHGLTLQLYDARMDFNRREYVNGRVVVTVTRRLIAPNL